MHHKTNRRPIIDPVILALKSRRVMVALAALIVGVIVSAIPELEVVRNELLTLLITLALAVIGGYSIEDAAGIARTSEPPADLREQIKEVLDSVIDDIADNASEH